ncbi:MAG: PD-(D/E)XK nuclease-like domain-containing protein [Oscillospiraceae bacterium]
MTELEYRSHPAISRSELFRIADSPEKFIYRREHPEPPTEALIFGQALHMSVLQPELYDDNFIVAPDVDRRTKAGKEIWNSFTDKIKGQTVITYDMHDKIERMTAKLNSNEYAAKLLNGIREEPVFWVDALTGEECKCRPDCVSVINGMDFIVDIKTASNADTETFMKHALKYGYHLQAAMYSEGLKAATGKSCGFVFIVIEKEPPYAVNIMQADKLFIQYGYDVFRELIGIYHDCKLNNNWYGYLGKFNVVNNLGIPAYLMKEVE